MKSMKSKSGSGYKMVEDAMPAAKMKAKKKDQSTPKMTKPAKYEKSSLKSKS
jgi:hypothetical protein